MKAILGLGWFLTLLEGERSLGSIVVEHRHGVSIRVDIICYDHGQDALEFRRAALAELAERWEIVKDPVD
jgi:hypothetical protein